MKKGLVKDSWLSEGVIQGELSRGEFRMRGVRYRCFSQGIKYVNSEGEGKGEGTFKVRIYNYYNPL